MNSRMYEIDSDKLGSLINKWGGHSAVAEKIYRTDSALRITLRRGTISEVIANAIYKAYGVPLEEYAKEEPKEVIQQTMELKGDGADKLTELLCQITSMLDQITKKATEMCNNHIVFYKRINHLTGAVTRLEDEVKLIREKVEKL